MLKAAAERIVDESRSMEPEFLQAWIQLVKAPARSFEKNGRAHKMGSGTTIGNFFGMVG
jgi:hypothetical protein